MLKDNLKLQIGSREINQNHKKWKEMSFHIISIYCDFDFIIFNEIFIVDLLVLMMENIYTYEKLFSFIC